ncbi:MAG: hypothetical protein ACYSUD_21985 [Planctomycetota bacterium]|jgi:hypothetical protein
MDKEFLRWLAEYLKSDEKEVTKLLENELARYFLIVWSICEAKCFDGYAKPGKLHKFAKENAKTIEAKRINNNAEYFHKRYQDKEKYSNLIHDRKNASFKKILEKEYLDVAIEENIFLLAFVAYRYRNNIFHGNKGISSWLKFEKQIEKCIDVLQVFIDASLESN